MRPFLKSVLSIAVTILLVSGLVKAQERDRSSVADKYKWNLTDLYPSQAAWQESKKRVTDDLSKLQKYRGTLGNSAEQLAGCLDLVNNLAKDFYRLFVYARMNYDQDTRVQTSLGMVQEMTQLSATIGANTAFIEPEIIVIDREKVNGFISANKGLAVYKHYLDDLMRRKAHTGTEGEERIIALATPIANTGYDVYDIFSGSELPYPRVVLSSGDTVTVNRSTYPLYRALPGREDRKKVFSAFFSKLDSFRRTYGTELNAGVQRDIFYQNARNYGSCLESALDAGNIPTEIYRSLIANVDKNLPAFHRYLKLRQRMMGLSELHYYDVYAPIVPGVDLKYDYEQAEKNVLASVKPLGEEYVSVVRKAFNERWIDVYPYEGKNSGGYTSGAYDVHPYIKLNFNGQYDDVSTLAHEMGHAMQSYFSDHHQPFATSQYPIFTAEVASTLNEAALMDYMLGQIKDDKAKLSILGNYLENIRGTLFRQTQFAEFELRIHEMAERGESLTGDVLDTVYYSIAKKYYGHDQGICTVDDEMKSEWIYIPHFYYNFYVYQYATSFTASTALSEKILSGDTASTKKYIEFLSAGGSDYPIEILKKAGVDMTTSEPFDLTIRKMNRVMDEMESILDRMKG